MSIKGIGFVLKNLPTGKTPGPLVSLVNSIKHLRKK